MTTKKTNYITKEGYQKLLNELQDYRDVKLPEVLERLSEAKALGDLSENFEYKSAMEDKDFINSKVSEIEKMLANVEIMEEEGSKTKQKSEFVDYGSMVTLQIEGDKDSYRVQIVGIGEAAIKGDDDLLISLDSPVGYAIKGHKAGEEVKMRIGNERKAIKILKVE